MSAAVSQPSVDERVVGAGTGARFAVLLVLMLVTTGAMALSVLWLLHAADGVGCVLAAGGAPERAGTSAESVRLSGQWLPFWACMDRYVPVPPWWQAAVAPCLLAAVAALLFLLLPAWKIRRRRLVGLQTVDSDGALLRLVDEAAAVSGLVRVPRVVVDRAAPTAGAAIFGRTRRPVLVLHGGLIARRSSDPAHLRTVLLHEFAHISNRDITITYATVALWRTFGVLVLLPYLVWTGYEISGFGATAWLELSPLDVRTLLLPLVLAGLVGLARSDVLRVREIHADLTAIRAGADLHRAVITAQQPVAGRLRRTFAPVKALWSTHPESQVRRSALTDPAPVFAQHAAPALLTGVSAVLIHVNLIGALSAYRPLIPWVYQGAALLPALLVCGVLGTALWRSVAYAALTGARPPIGMRTGGWLGVGLAAGSLVGGRGAGSAQWLGGSFVGLATVAASAVVFTVWFTLCARLWVGVWRGRSLRPALLLCLVGAFVVAAVWFAWLTPQGAYEEYFRTIAPDRRHLIEQLYPGGPKAGSATVFVLATVLPLVATSMTWPMFAAAAAAAWMVPTLALALGRPANPPRWAARARPAGTGRLVGSEAPPTLRRALMPGLVAGVVSWFAAAGVLAYFHAGQGWQAGASGNWAVRVESGLFPAVVGPTALAALAAIGARHPLAPLIAAQTTAAVGLVGSGLLVSFDGCLAPLSSRGSTCGWHPAWRVFPKFEVFGFVNAVLLVACSAAVVAAFLQQVAGRIHRRTEANPVKLSSARPIARWSAVATSASMVLVLAVGEPVVLSGYQTSRPDYATAQRQVQRLLVQQPPVSAETRARQVRAWYDHGGQYLLANAIRYADQLRVLKVPMNGTSAERDLSLSRIRALCVDIAAIGAWEDGYYFRVPDTDAQADWHKFGTGAREGGRTCLAAVDQRPFDTNAYLALILATYDLDIAGSDAASADSAVVRILAEAGYRTG
ncbi:M48 family metalloprotease [Kitasatospora sp. NPDC096147]|uniref:M48 family metalloprotease n=1 Tax=Kitasatospora sp. NPDC096147 TaxID=3364093 RepID=UPI00381D9FC4